MDDLFIILDCALRSRYLASKSLPDLPVWKKLPDELRTALEDALATEKPCRLVIWQVRVELPGKPERDYTGERNEAMVALQLGLLYLKYREGRLDFVELLSHAFHVADSWICNVEARPFLRLRADLVAGQPDDGRLEELFAPYTGLAEVCVARWGLRGEPNAELPHLGEDSR